MSPSEPGTARSSDGFKGRAQVGPAWCTRCVTAILHRALFIFPRSLFPAGLCHLAAQDVAGQRSVELDDLVCPDLCVAVTVICPDQQAGRFATNLSACREADVADVGNGLLAVKLEDHI